MTLRNTTIASVIALTLGTAAYADTDPTVRDALDANGYEHIALTDLTEPEKAEIYITATSDSQSDVRRVLDGMQLASAPKAEDMTSDSSDRVLLLTVPADMTSDATMEVQDELMERGYTEAQISTLTDNEVAQLYITMTSEDSSEVDEVLTGIFDS